MNLTQMFLGWRNNLFPPEQLKEMINKTSQTRLEICNECFFHSKNHNTPIRPDHHCTDCGCNLDAKTKCLSCKCPQDKWEALMSLVEERDLLKKLKDEAKKKNASA